MRVLWINILGFLVQIILSVASYQKDIKAYSRMIILSRIPDIPCYLLAGDYPSIGFSALGALRAYLSCKKKYTFSVSCLFEMVIIVFTLLFNKMGWPVLMPLIGTTISNFYFLCSDYSLMIVLSVVNNFIYIFYFLMIRNYTGSIMLVVATAMQLPAMIRHIRNMKQHAKV